MTDKVRRIDWSPDEWLSGTRGLRKVDTGVYITVINLIYSRGGDCPDDAAFINGQFGDERNVAREVQRTRQALDRLIAKGKLRVQTTHAGRWLVNGRADRELGKAQSRIASAAKAGVASGKVRRAASGKLDQRQRLDTGSTLARQRLDPKSSDNNGLTRTAVRNHQPPIKNTDREISTEAGRASRPATRGPPARAPKPDKSAKRLAELARKFHEDQR